MSDTDAITRPPCVNEEHLEYLDELRESGVTNMYGAGRYVEREFAISHNKASEIVQYWMASFGKDDR